MSYFLSFLAENLPAWRSRSNGWCIGNCPVCTHNGESRPDHRLRGGYEITSNMFKYRCFNCGERVEWTIGDTTLFPNFRRLLTQGFNIDFIDVQRALMAEKKELFKYGIFETEITEVEEPKPHVIEWPEKPLPANTYPLLDVPVNSLDRRTLNNFVSACEYIESRRIEWYKNWHFCTDKELNGRVMIPYYYKGKVVGYTARATYKTANRYISEQPKNFLFNVDNQNTHDKSYVFVHEGPIDAIYTDGVAICNNVISDEVRQIIDGFDKQVVVVPDFSSDGMVMVKLAIKYGWAVSFPEWGYRYKDTGKCVEEHGRAFAIYSIIKSIEYNPTKITLLARKMCVKK